MKIGATVILKEVVMVIDSLGTDLLLKGVCGVVESESGNFLTLIVGGKTYDNIPTTSVDMVPEDNAA